MTEFLNVHAVSRRYGDAPNEVTALDEVSLTIAAGEMVAIVGPSGSGKSTLLSIMGGLESPSAGSVVLDGVDLWSLDAAALAAVRRRQIGFVFQGYNLLSGLTACENVAAPLELDGVGRRAARAEALERLERVGLENRADAFPDDLSGGEQQRVAIARALVADRTVVLADEPTGALDQRTGVTTMAQLRAACAGTSAVVVVTHDPQVARIADRVIALRDGRVTDSRDVVSA